MWLKQISNKIKNLKIMWILINNKKIIRGGKLS